MTETKEIKSKIDGYLDRVKNKNTKQTLKAWAYMLNAGDMEIAPTNEQEKDTEENDNVDSKSNVSA